MLPQLVFTGADRAPTVNCQMGPVRVPMRSPVEPRTRQNQTPRLSAFGTVAREPSTRKIWHSVVMARSRHTSTDAPSVCGAGAQRISGRCDVTMPVLDGAIG